MTLSLCRGVGGEIALPPRNLVLVDRLDGGHLAVHPPREVWERSELTPEELTQWSFLVAATGRAMLETLPQLHEGCLNYWEAGNWSLHDLAEPLGLKIPRRHRRVHMHLFGRSRSARSPAWKWGEAPRFPHFTDRFTWAATHQPLEPDECRAIVARAEDILLRVYGVRSRG
ncbi:MAG: hypothetical protein ABI565_07155 [Vicinamibacteria bacterium]